MPEYLAPAVYVEETSFRSKSIEGVGTSTAAFVGLTARGPTAITPPLLTSFAADVKTAGLVSDLNSMHSFTVFAPANSAFSRLPHAEMSMMHSSAELAKILKYHIVSGRVTPAKLASGMALTTLEGGSLTGAKMGSVYEIGKASVICGNIQTANATVYVINKVLVPMR